MKDIVCRFTVKTLWRKISVPKPDRKWPQENKSFQQSAIKYIKGDRCESIDALITLKTSIIPLSPLLYNPIVVYIGKSIFIVYYSIYSFSFSSNQNNRNMDFSFAFLR